MSIEVDAPGNVVLVVLRNGEPVLIFKLEILLLRCLLQGDVGCRNWLVRTPIATHVEVHLLSIKLLDVLLEILLEVNYDEGDIIRTTQVHCLLSYD